MSLKHYCVHLDDEYKKEALTEEEIKEICDRCFEDKTDTDEIVDINVDYFYRNIPDIKHFIYVSFDEKIMPNHLLLRKEYKAYCTKIVLGRKKTFKVYFKNSIMPAHV